MSQTLEVRMEQIGPTAIKGSARSHTLVVDRPNAKGGTDQGPIGGEYLLLGLGGCFTSHLLAAIRAREADIRDVKVAVSGTMEGSPERFVAFTMKIEATCDDAELLNKVVTIAERSCQVVNTLKQGATVSLVVQQSSATPIARSGG